MEISLVVIMLCSLWCKLFFAFRFWRNIVKQYVLSNTPIRNFVVRRNLICGPGIKKLFQQVIGRA